MAGLEARNRDNGVLYRFYLSDNIVLLQLSISVANLRYV